MKHRSAVVFAAALALSLLTITAFAAPGEKGRNYSDENNDGICDNFDSYEQRCRGNGDRTFFTDSDGDGICDNARSESLRPQDGSGRKNGAENRQGKGFADSDGNGYRGNNARQGKRHGKQ